MLTRTSTHTVAARRMLSAPAVVDIKMPELSASLPRRWETAYIRDKREYKEQVRRYSVLVNRCREWSFKFLHLLFRCPGARIAQVLFGIASSAHA